MQRTLVTLAPTNRNSIRAASKWLALYALVGRRHLLQTTLECVQLAAGRCAHNSRLVTCLRVRNLLNIFFYYYLFNYN